MHLLTQTKSSMNAPIRIDVPARQPIVNESKACMKRGRPIGSKDKNPWNREEAKNDDQVEDSQEKLVPPEEPLDNDNVPIPKEP